MAVDTLKLAGIVATLLVAIGILPLWLGEWGIGWPAARYRLAFSFGICALAAILLHFAAP